MVKPPPLPKDLRPPVPCARCGKMGADRYGGHFICLDCKRLVKKAVGAVRFDIVDEFVKGGESYNVGHFWHQYKIKLQQAAEVALRHEQRAKVRAALDATIAAKKKAQQEAPQ